MKPTSFRLPADTLDRIRRFAQPGESQASVILRALIALEGVAPPLSMEALASRLEAVESRLDELTSGSAPVVQTVSTDTKTPATDTRSAPVVQPDKAARDRRILELVGLSEVRASEILIAEGFSQCSPRTVANVRNRLSQHTTEE